LRNRYPCRGAIAIGDLPLLRYNYTVPMMKRPGRVILILVVSFRLLRACPHVTSGGKEDKTSISILTLAPYAGGGGKADPGWRAGPAVIPAVRLAVDVINSRTDILPGYEIQLLEGNSGCQYGPKSVYSFVSNIFYDGAKVRTSSHVVGVIGPACSESALLLGTLGARDTISLIQISPGATSPLLTDTAKYRNTFRTLSTALQHIGAVVELMALNSWENVAVLHDSTRVYFRLISEKLITNYSAKIGFDSGIDETFYPFGSLEAQYKVIVLIAGSQLAREVMCLAYNHKPQLIYPVYQWIIVDKTKDLFITNTHFTFNGRFYNCSASVMNKAVEGALFTTYRLLGHEDKEQSTDVGLTVTQYDECYAEYHKQHLEQLAPKERAFEADAKEYALSYYDATWALALALNATFYDNATVPLSEYRHRQPETTSIIRKHLNQITFEGLMGRIAFRKSTQDSSTPLNIHQCINGESVLIGVYNGTGIDILSDKAEFVVDEFHRRVIGVHPAATTIVTLLVIALVVYALALHMTFIAFHSHRSIKAASFSMSHFMFSGCYLILLRVFLTAAAHANGWETTNIDEYYTRDIAFGVVCNISEWLNSIGVSLVMGTLCGMLWRIYRIFNHFNTRSYLISDFTLTLFIVVVETVNVVILVLWTTVDPLLAVFEEQGVEYDGKDQPIILERAHCRCSYFSLWISLTYAVILSLVTCIVVLSLLNRHVNRRYFQMAKSVNVMVYMLAMSCFLGIVFAFVFESHNIHYAYISWQISLLSIVLLVSVFMLSPPASSVVKGKFLMLTGHL
jgi:gamma-aminobutyric acid type B receptor